MTTRSRDSIATTRLKVGMEIHVELATRTRMFSRSPNVAHPDFMDAEPNTLIDPVVLGLPGALPVMNKAAVEMAMMVGLALNCRINRTTHWERKNYFYPDLPKGYQISQYEEPLCVEGRITIQPEDATDGAGGPFEVRITRAHLEEDTGKLGHELPGGGHYEGSLIDFNRAGTPLLEIVTEPDFTSADQVVAFARELHAVCRHVGGGGVTQGIMQRGHMRFEPNINVIITLKDGTEIATPVVEVKNLNSFRHVKLAIEHEAQRQVMAWIEDGLEMGPNMKNTRGWDDVRGCTVLQRTKEDAHDYRYFPDPDLPPVAISDAWIERVRARVGELPAARRARYMKAYGFGPKEASALVEDPATTAYYEAAIAESAAAGGGTERGGGDCGGEIGKLLLNAVAKRANERGVTPPHLGLAPKQLADVARLRASGQVGGNAADELIGLLVDAGPASPAETVARERGLIQVRDDAALERWVDEAIAAQTQAASDFAAGKDAAMGRIVGHVMKVSGGTADAKGIREMLVKKLRPAS